ncbi:hypothetical protein [Streptomyces alanosinicus]|uniref:Helix-turn-helix domain-containing protein n=1 Tax=Streptomyces alanosinicus TaxID=68171 RepID=A0A919D5K8_9ACTN|nr:hypothetical protein [Streptomyces alanosinicus]GHE09189.1 hypothetical protein GCM10010339_60600 [Streptomyces alanosinicus]
MTILRRHLSTGFTVLPTATIEDSRLSFRARGILAFLLAKPDNWKVRSESIAAAGQEGRDAVRKALRELRTYGYYRVVTERLDDGTLVRVTEVHDTAQEWASEEYSRQVGRRVARRLQRDMKEAPADAGEEDEQAEDGFSGVGEPGVGEPAAGSSGFLVSNQNQYTEKNPPTPTAGAAGEPDDAAVEEGKPPSCPRHLDGLGRSCRGCGTSPRQMREREERAEKERFKSREREANERVLAQVQRKPGVEGLSEVAQQQLAQMREVRRAAAVRGEGVESPRQIG